YLAAHGLQADAPAAPPAPKEKKEAVMVVVKPGVQTLAMSRDKKEKKKEVMVVVKPGVQTLAMSHDVLAANQTMVGSKGTGGILAANQTMVGPKGTGVQFQSKGWDGADDGVTKPPPTVEETNRKVTKQQAKNDEDDMMMDVEDLLKKFNVGGSKFGTAEEGGGEDGEASEAGLCKAHEDGASNGESHTCVRIFFFFVTLSLEMSDPIVHAP
ncbi:hypothetical protein T484DRAFT_1766572, partial [Baffinella frigidus]